MNTGESATMATDAGSGRDWDEATSREKRGSTSHHTLAVKARSLEETQCPHFQEVRSRMSGRRE